MKSRTKAGDHSANWKETMRSHREQCRIANFQAGVLRRNAAIRKGSLSAGKVVVIPPSGK